MLVYSPVPRSAKLDHCSHGTFQCLMISMRNQYFMEVCDLPKFPELFGRRAKISSYMFPLTFFISHHMSSALLAVSGVYTKINPETW